MNHTELACGPQDRATQGAQASEAPTLIKLLFAHLAVPRKDWPKNMELTSIGESGFVLRGECPHCQHLAAFSPVTKSFTESSGKVREGRMITALRCVACYGYILGIVKLVPDQYVSSQSNWVYETHYPLGKAPQLSSSDIPEHIVEDFNEALRCRWADAYNATVEMCRRALQSSCEGLGADSSLKIEAQIDWVASQGKITSFLQQIAHTIRLAGNRGAHPPRVITEEEADAVIQFTREYFQHVYLTAARMTRFDFSKSASKKKP